METQNLINTSDLSNFTELLKDFKPPRQRGTKCPFMLWGAWGVDHCAANANQPTMKYRLVTHMFRSVPPSDSKISYYKNKGWVLLDFWFPDKQDLPAKRVNITENGWIGMLRGADDYDPYAEARSRCRTLKAGAAGNYEKDIKINSLQAELEALKAKENVKNTDVRRSAKASVSSEA